jgi:phosphopantothenoylcysteine decarboxylase/phosphopantothenate--cysteine ligase
MRTSVLFGKKILLGVSGSIAAYKAALLVRQLRNEGAEVRVVMTSSAQDFITPLTLATLSSYRVYSDFTENSDQGTWTNHVELGLWPDLFLIAPASANTLAGMAIGKADNFLLATYLSCRSSVMVAPAMDLDMFAHPATEKNLLTLQANGVVVIGPETGELASGLHGKGRMTEPEDITDFLRAWFYSKQPLHGIRVLITAGPTWEALDPVRFIGNRSSGKMGVAIAEAFQEFGADVSLIAGPGCVSSSRTFIERIDVESSDEMAEACFTRFPGSTVTIMAAAVADYKPWSVSPEKIKKSSEHIDIKLTKTTDILSRLGDMKQPDQLLVGFALETENETENALRKLSRKKLDLIVLNSLRDNGAGFGTDTNKVSFVFGPEKIIVCETKSKKEVARDLTMQVLEMLRK